MGSINKNREKIILLFISILFLFLFVGIIFYKGWGNGNGKRIKIGLILTGSMKDGGWNEAHFTGMEEACEVLHANLLVKENISEYDESICVAIEELAEAGVAVLYIAGYNFGDCVMAMHEAYPDIFFFRIEGNSTKDNVASYFSRMYQARYLTGIVAGVKTKTNKIGYVAAEKIPEVLRGINAFTLGVRSVNPTAVVHVKWTYAWDDQQKEYIQAKWLVQKKGVDILTYHQNKNNVVEIAEDLGVYSIGYHLDDSEKYSDRYLTSAIWDWENFYMQSIRECLYGNYKEKNYCGSILDGDVKLGEISKEVSPDIQSNLGEAVEKWKAGWDVFNGPLYDNSGQLRIHEGENISDDYLVSDLDWFVEGVEED